MTRSIPDHPTDAAAEAAIEVLGAGGTVVLPTDTVYGLAAAPAIDGSTDALFTRKGRSDQVPIAVLCASADQAFALARHIPEQAEALARNHWPGPLTLVLSRRTDLAWNLGEPAATIGVRCPDTPLIARITAVLGPIATTSANRHGVPTPSTPMAAAASLTEPPDLVIDGGELAGEASTVIDATGSELRVLRAGPIKL